MKAKRNGSGLLEELVAKRASHACCNCIPLHSHKPLHRHGSPNLNSHTSRMYVYACVCVCVLCYPPQCMQIYVHFATITCINTTMTKKHTYNTPKSRIKDRIIRYYEQRKKERKGPRKCGSVKNAIERRWVGEIGRGFRGGLLDSNSVGVVEVDLNRKEKSL